MPKTKFVGNTTRPGDPKWDEYVDPDTGESTLEVHEPKNIPLCAPGDHIFYLIDANGNVACEKCPMGTRIIYGKQELVEGKIINLSK